MLITKAGLDSILIARVGTIMGVVSFSVATDGSNPNTVESIRTALAALGIPTASLTAVTDADLAQVAAASVPQLIDVSEWALRTACLDALTDVDTQVDRDTEKLSQLADRWQRKIDALYAQLTKSYGFGAATLSSGTIDLGFAATDCDTWGGFD